MLRMYEKMATLCHMDQQLYKAQRMVCFLCSCMPVQGSMLRIVQGLISFYMMSSGEEATHFGSAAALDGEDMVYAQYREPGQCPASHQPLPLSLTVTVGVLLWRGFSMDEMLDQCFNNRHDLAHGRQMPIHYGSPEHNFQFISSPLATQMPQGAICPALCAALLIPHIPPLSTWLCLWTEAGWV